MSRFVVKENIPVGGVWAATRGQTLDSDHVEANGWQDYVVGENTREARDIKAEITGRDAADFDTKASGSSSSSSRAAAQTSSEQKG